MISLYKFSWVLLHCWVISLLLFGGRGDGSGISVNFTEAPNSTSRLSSATFSFEVWEDRRLVSQGGNGASCASSNINCSCLASNITCKLDDGITTDCGNKAVSYTGLHDGKHKFEVCSVASPAVRCSSYNWIIDTVPPTAYITSTSSFTNAANVSVNISFTEPCIGEDGKDGFKCSSENACNLLAYGDGQVIPSSLVTLVPTRKYTLFVNLSSGVQYGNVTLEMDDKFCTDTAGNQFIKSQKSTFNISFDRRNLLVNLHSAVPEKLLSLDSGNLSLLATNNLEDLKLYLNFSQPVAISATDVRNSLSTSEGTLVGIRGENLGDRTFGFQVVNVPPTYAIINVSFDSESISRKLGNPVSPIEPITFLYDTRRPQVELYTESERTTQDIIPIWIRFSKTVLNFKESPIVSISGGHLVSFEERPKSNRTLFLIKIQADEDFVSVKVPENVAEDVFGNKNQAKTLRVRHDPEPALSRVTSTFVTSTFGITCLAQGMLAVSSVSGGTISGASFSLTSDPATNFFLSLGHIQLVALSRWLPVNLPNKYYDYAKGLEWSIPYLNLPWEKAHVSPANAKATKLNHLDIYQNELPKEVNSRKAATLVPRHGQPSAGNFESTVMGRAENARSNYLDSQESDGWRDFKRSMFWLAVIGGSLILLHGLVILIIEIRFPHIHKDYGALTFPRFEIFCIIVALPCICKASTSLIRVEGGHRLAVMVGTLLLCAVFFILLCFFLFLLVGVTLGMLLLYDEAYYEEGQEQGKLHRFIRSVTLGPNLRGQWKWKHGTKKVYLRILGPLFEDLRGINSQNRGGGGGGDRINPYNEETEVAEALGVNLRKNGDGIIASSDKSKDAGGNSKRNGDDIIASDDITEDARGPGEIPNENDDNIIISDNKTEDTRGAGGNAWYGDGIFREEASLTQKLLSIPRTYYILLATVRQVTLGILAGAYISDDESSKSPEIITQAMNCFLLFFLVFLKPFISKRGLVVEINSLFSEVALFTFILLLSVIEFSPGIKAIFDYCMVLLPFIAYVVGMLNQCYAFYKHIKHMDMPKQESFLRGLKKAFSRFLDFFLLREQTESWEHEKGRSRETGPSAHRNKSSTTTEKTGMKQPGEPIKSLPSSGKQASVAPNDPHQEQY